jgi:cytochrome bd-type quinol oxidase subunit 2
MIYAYDNLTSKRGIIIFLYTTIEAIAAVVTGILIAVCTKKADGIVYSKLDKVGRIINILLIPVYVCLAPLYMFLGMIANPRYDGFLGVLGWTVSIIMASAALFCGVGLGLSVAFRKKGKSKLSFAVQFAGVGGIGLTVILFFLFYGNLLRPIN